MEREKSMDGGSVLLKSDHSRTTLMDLSTQDLSFLERVLKEMAVDET
jgi:hypothetical protein